MVKKTTQEQLTNACSIWDNKFVQNQYAKPQVSHNYKSLITIQ
jgi:hypothetical protein